LVEWWNLESQIMMPFMPISITFPAPSLKTRSGLAGGRRLA
jgi:hypothetical protein